MECVRFESLCVVEAIAKSVEHCEYALARHTESVNGFINCHTCPVSMCPMHKQDRCIG